MENFSLPNQAGDLILPTNTIATNLINVYSARAQDVRGHLEMSTVTHAVATAFHRRAHRGFQSLLSIAPGSPSCLKTQCRSLYALNTHKKKFSSSNVFSAV